jgi:hypothetical protein
MVNEGSFQIAEFVVYLRTDVAGKNNFILDKDMGLALKRRRSPREEMQVCNRFQSRCPACT